MSIVRKGAIVLFASSIGGSILRMVFTAILARLLTPLDFGLIATAMIITGFADLFVQFGFGKGLVQLKYITKNDVEFAYLGSVVLGVFCGLVVFFLAPYIALYFEQPELSTILKHLSFLFPINSFSQVQFSLLQRNMQFKKLAGRDVLSYAIGYGVVGIILANYNFGVYSLVYALLVQAVIYSLLLSYGQSDYKVRFSYNRKSFIKLYTFGKSFTLSQIWNYFALKGDYFVVGKLLGTSSLGFYSKAYGLMNIPNNILGRVLNTVLFANYSKHQDDKYFLTKSIRKGITLLFFIIGPISIIAIVLAKEIVLLLLGEQWIDAIAPFKILCSIIVFRIGYKIFGTFLKSTGQVKKFARIQFIYFVAVVFSSLLGSYYGIEYVATGTSLAVILMFFMLLNETIKQSNYKFREFVTMVFYALLYCIIVSILPVITYYLLLSTLDSILLKFIVTSTAMLFSMLFVIMNKKIMKSFGASVVYREISSYINKIGFK